MSNSHFQIVRSTIALFLTISLSCISIFLFSSSMIYKHFDAQSLKTDNNTVYLLIQHESDPTKLPNTPETLHDLLTLYNDLSQSNACTYYELYAQPIVPTSGPFFDFYTEEWSDTPQEVYAVQLSANVQKDFALSVSSGRLLKALDFTLHSKQSIPVLLGASYASRYSLGDTFRADYLYHTYPFVVVGFLDKGSEIATSNSTMLLDQAVVMPSFLYDGTPKTKSAYTSLKIHYANKVSGSLRMKPEQLDAVSAQVTSLLQDTPVGTFSWFSSIWGDQPILWGMNLRTLSIVSALVGLLAILASLILLARIARNTARKTLSFVVVFVIHIIAFAASIGVYQSVLIDRLELNLLPLVPYPLLFCAVELLVFLVLLWRKKAQRSPNTI